jgi:putative endonuclease
MTSCFCYILECQTGKIYIGVTESFNRRLKEHITGKGGAKYTHANGVYCIRLILCLKDKSEAMKLEKKLKKKTRKQKEDFIKLDKNREQTKRWISAFKDLSPLTKEEEFVYDNSLGY